jgi:phage tail-like protein
MADDGSAQSASVWPIAKFYFSVKIGNLVSSFQEVSGLDVETQVIEYRHADSPIFSNQKMPGLVKFSNITLKKGIFKDGKAFQDVCNKSTMNTVVRQTVVISLLDEDNKVTMKWTLQNAWVTKMSGTNVKSDTNEGLVETMELAHEGLTIGQ